MSISLLNISRLYIHNIDKYIKPKDMKHASKIMNANKKSKITAITKDQKIKIVQIGLIEEDFIYSS